MMRKTRIDRGSLGGMTEPPKSQAEKFRELARELEADEGEAAFEETLKRIAPKAPSSHETPGDKAT